MINLVKHWLEDYFEDDFAAAYSAPKDVNEVSCSSSSSSNQQLLQQLRDLINKVGKTNKRFEQLLFKTLRKKELAYTFKQKQQQVQLDMARLDQLALNSVSGSATPDSVLIDFNNLKNIFMMPTTPTTMVSGASCSSVSSRSSSTTSNEELAAAAAAAAAAANFQQLAMEDSAYPPFETHLEDSYAYELLTIHPLEFARQATLMEEEIFKAIKPSELISLGWNKPAHKYKLSPNVTKLINLSNKLTYYYAKCILDTLNLEERVAVVQR